MFDLNNLISLTLASIKTEANDRETVGSEGLSDRKNGVENVVVKDASPYLFLSTEILDNNRFE
jgi:hypothetical protein